MADKPTLTEEQKLLFDDLTRLQQEIVTNSISGMKDIDAYKASSGKAKTIKAMESSVSEILGNPKVKAFRDSMAESALTNAVMTKQEVLERLSNLARVNMSDLIEFATVASTDDEGQPIQQSTWQFKDSALQSDLSMASIAEVAATKDGFKIKQHSPLAAMKQLSDLAGYNTPTQVDSTLKVITADDEQW